MTDEEHEELFILTVMEELLIWIENNDTILINALGE